MRLESKLKMEFEKSQWENYFQVRGRIGGGDGRWDGCRGNFPKVSVGPDGPADISIYRLYAYSNTLHNLGLIFHPKIRF